ncbi:MAG: mechanosensitive ion channel, partial [Caldilineaceae bacterium]|nr:mechanosensitive ion channel [Caldilineaceae bacterium]
AIEALQRLVEGWQAFLRLLPVLAVGLLVMAASFLAARLMARPARLWRRISANPFVARMVSQLVQLGVVLTGAFLTLLLLDATPILRTLLGAAGIIGLALGFALRDTVENYIASVLLSLRRPFGPEDYVRIEGHEGIVLRLTTRATILLTLDGNEVRIPNAMVFKGVITNFTKEPRRRFTFQLGIAPGEDLAAAQRAAIESLQGVSGVMADPAPAAYYERIGDSAVELTVLGWMDQRSKTKIRRMAKYHPDVKLIVIDAKAYKSIARDVGGFIVDWE